MNRINTASCEYLKTERTQVQKNFLRSVSRISLRNLTKNELISSMLRANLIRSDILPILDMKKKQLIEFIVSSIAENNTTDDERNDYSDERISIEDNVLAGSMNLDQSNQNIQPPNLFLCSSEDACNLFVQNKQNTYPNA